MIRKTGKGTGFYSCRYAAEYYVSALAPEVSPLQIEETFSGSMGFDINQRNA